ncbi:MAG: Asp-tRNA(Asn)/Glu-tRNA(Gln) amidotransferase subunit GatC [Ethanoligenens sp.]|uniref:Asp-tRNA(Asn)/Glu-tRNA(Gln) amidotransferase subunit GatC n=1 Tax=Ethanoligenens sp. TaxID=2099655 RepID=UPI0039EA2F7C
MDQAPDIERIARLAQMELSDEEKTALEKDLAAVIGYMDVLSKIDTDGVEPMEHVLGLSNVLRADEPVPSFDRARLLDCAPKTEDGYYDVPLAVEQE